MKTRKPPSKQPRCEPDAEEDFRKVVRGVVALDRASGIPAEGTRHAVFAALDDAIDFRDQQERERWFAVVADELQKQLG